MRMTRQLISTGICILLLFSTYSNYTLAEKQQYTSVNPDNQPQVKRGKMVYNRFCSLCHGVDLKGQAQWHKPKADGKMPAPPHDESGHTWHHPDEILFTMTKFGMVPPHAPEGYESDMPAWKDTLSDSDIWATLSYIKSRWPKETRQAHDRINKEYRERK